MDNINAEDFSTKYIGHLGLVADKINSLSLIDLIDKSIPINMKQGAKVTHGERVAAMILNGLGFTEKLR